MKSKEEKLIKRDLQQPEWIGEDGCIAIDIRFSKRYAWLKMKKLSTDEGADADYIKEGDLEVGYLRLATPQEQQDEGWDWAISKNKTNYPVWVFWG